MSGEKEKIAAFGEETFKNLRPGETRQFKGVMQICGLDKNTQDHLSVFRGLCDEDFSHGKSSYTVDVLPQENKN